MGANQVFAVALTSGVVAKTLLRRSSVPYTVLLTVMGGILGLANDAAKPGTAFSKSALGISVNEWMEVNPHVLIFVFLPVLIFESALNCEWHIFKRQLNPILALAVPGVAVSTVVTALIIKYTMHPDDDRWDTHSTLTLGAILAATVRRPGSHRPQNSQACFNSKCSAANREISATRGPCASEIRLCPPPRVVLVTRFLRHSSVV